MVKAGLLAYASASNWCPIPFASDCSCDMLGGDSSATMPFVSCRSCAIVRSAIESACGRQGAASVPAPSCCSLLVGLSHARFACAVCASKARSAFPYAGKRDVMLSITVAAGLKASELAFASRCPCAVSLVIPPRS